MKKVGIIFAMSEEIEAMKKLIKIDKENQIFELTFFEATINNLQCFMVQSGMGKVNAARTAQILIDYYKVDYLFNVGVAGGVDSSLAVGDIVIGNNLVQHDFDAIGLNFERGLIPNAGKFFKCDDYLCKIANSKIEAAASNKVINGVIASGDIFCTEPEMGEKINKRFNALCVEMEGAAVAQVCVLCKIPFLIIRAISDVPNNNNKITFDQFLANNIDVMAKAIKNTLDGLN